MVGNLSEGAKSWWGIGGGDQQVMGNLSEGTKRWWGI